MKENENSGVITSEISQALAAHCSLPSALIRDPNLDVSAFIALRTDPVSGNMCNPTPGQRKHLKRTSKISMDLRNTILLPRPVPLRIILAEMHEFYLDLSNQDIIEKGAWPTIQKILATNPDKWDVLDFSHNKRPIEKIEELARAKVSEKRHRGEVWLGKAPYIDRIRVIYPYLLMKNFEDVKNRLLALNKNAKIRFPCFDPRLLKCFEAEIMLSFYVKKINTRDLLRNIFNI